LSSEAHRQTLVARGRERVAQFTWERSTNGLLSVFSELLAARAREENAPSLRRIRRMATAITIAPLTPHAGGRKRS
jgi:hypothetical protein